MLMIRVALCKDLAALPLLHNYDVTVMRPLAHDNRRSTRGRPTCGTGLRAGV